MLKLRDKEILDKTLISTLNSEGYLSQDLRKGILYVREIVLPHLIYFCKSFKTTPHGFTFNVIFPKTSQYVITSLSAADLPTTS